MKKDTGIRVKYGVPYFIVRVMAIGMLFLILNTSNILAATESPVVLDLSMNQTTLEQPETLWQLIYYSYLIGRAHV